jgi:hypothetical protein
MLYYNPVVAGIVEKPEDYLYSSAQKLLWNERID